MRSGPSGGDPTALTQRERGRRRYRPAASDGARRGAAARCGPGARVLQSPREKHQDDGVRPADQRRRATADGEQRRRVLGLCVRG
jgi:hypothetical protein